MAKFLRPLVLSLILCASHARTFSLIHGYSAPLEIYKILDHYEDAGQGEKLHLLLAYIDLDTVVFSDERLFFLF